MTANDPTTASGKEFEQPDEPPLLPADAVQAVELEEGRDGRARIRVDIEEATARELMDEHVPPKHRQHPSHLYAALAAWTHRLTVNGQDLTPWAEQRQDDERDQLADDLRE